MTTYYMVSIDNVPEAPTYEIWFAAWTAGQPQVVWSTERPTTGSDCIACIVASNVPIQGAPTFCAVKDLPPPAQTPLQATSMASFQKAFEQWLLARSA